MAEGTVSRQATAVSRVFHVGTGPAWPRLQQTNSLAAAREQLDAAVACLLEAATAELSGDVLLRKALADGQQMERHRVMALLLDRLEQHPRPSDTRRMLLLDLLEDVKG
jgi:hypothetical protein